MGVLILIRRALGVVLELLHQMIATAKVRVRYSMATAWCGLNSKNVDNTFDGVLTPLVVLRCSTKKAAKSILMMKRSSNSGTMGMNTSLMTLDPTNHCDLS